MAVVMSSAEEMRQNQAEGFRQVWEVAQDYKIENVNGQRVLVGSGRGQRFYAPAVEKQLLEAFRNVRDENGLLDFARHYGGLGHWALVDPNQRLGGDPVKWALAHAAQVRAIWDLLEIIEGSKNPRIEDLDSIRKSFSRAISAAGYHLIGEKKTGREHRFLWTVDWPKAPIRTAYQVVAALINPQIRGIYYHLDTHDKIPGLCLGFHALLEIIYWQLANRLRGEWRRCKRADCGNIFRLEEGRRGPKSKYCSARCQNTDKKRRNRERKRKKEAARKRIKPGRPRKKESTK